MGTIEAELAGGAPPDPGVAGRDATVREVADRLAAAHAEGRTIPPVRDDLAALGVAGAYAVQSELVGGWVAAGRRPVGHKIGLTSEAVQRQLGVSAPDLGTLLADMVLVDGEPVPAGAVLQARVEAEVALVVGRDLDAPDVTLVELLRAVEAVLPALEVVGSRIEGWDISILDTVADNASCGLVVLGTRPVAPGDLDLAGIGMSMEVGGAVVSVGSGAACLGHPYRAALWLARQRARAGTPVRAGDLIMTGALGPMASLPPGAAVVAHLQGLGTVRTVQEVGG